jgi:hypothetical protein
MSDSQSSRILTIVVGVALVAACVIFFIWQQQRASYRIPRTAHAAQLHQHHLKHQ